MNALRPSMPVGSKRKEKRRRREEEERSLSCSGVTEYPARLMPGGGCRLRREGQAYLGASAWLSGGWHPDPFDAAPSRN